MVGRCRKPKSENKRAPSYQAYFLTPHRGFLRVSNDDSVLTRFFDFLKSFSIIQGQRRQRRPCCWRLIFGALVVEEEAAMEAIAGGYCNWVRRWKLKEGSLALGKVLIDRE